MRWQALAAAGGVAVLDGGVEGGPEGGVVGDPSLPQAPIMTADIITAGAAIAASTRTNRGLFRTIAPPAAALDPRRAALSGFGREDNTHDRQGRTPKTASVGRPIAQNTR
jgi:hypothetical protein